MRSFMKEVPISVEAIDNGFIFDIIVALYHGADSAVVRICRYHTNIVFIQKNSDILLDNLALSNLIAIHEKTGIGRLSAYCGAVSAGCAAKIASSVQAGIMGYHMYQNDQQFRGGDGIVTKGVENTIRNVSQLGREGMRETDKEIVKIMLQES